MDELIKIYGWRFFFGLMDQLMDWLMDSSKSHEKAMKILQPCRFAKIKHFHNQRKNAVVHETFTMLEIPSTKFSTCHQSMDQAGATGISMSGCCTVVEKIRSSGASSCIYSCLQLPVIRLKHGKTAISHPPHHHFIGWL